MFNSEYWTDNIVIWWDWKLLVQSLQLNSDLVKTFNQFPITPTSLSYLEESY